jgi:hypothetical protein
VYYLIGFTLVEEAYHTDAVAQEVQRNLPQGVEAFHTHWEGLILEEVAFYIHR